MSGLIKKDLLTIKGNLKTVLIIVILFIFMSLKGNQDMAFILPLLCIMLFISTFSYDEYNNWNAYAITLPNGRKNVVKGKYLATIIIIVLSTIITVIISYLISSKVNDFNAEKMISTMIGGIFSVVLIVSIMYPLIFKYGSEKGRIGLFIASFVVIAIFGLFLNDTDVSKLSNVINFLNKYWMIIIPLILVGMIYMSYLISKKIYLNKEF